jgi:hypothetical protein
MPSLPVIFLAAAAAVAVAMPAQAQDQAVLDSPAGQLNGVIVWGKYSLTELSRVFPGQPATVNMGSVQPGFMIANEVVAFTAGRAPGFKKVENGWTGSPGALAVNFSPLVNLRVKVWVICADPDCLPLTAAASAGFVTKLMAANSLFAAQTAGISLNLTDPNLIVDLTANEDKKAKYKDFSSGEDQCGDFKDLVNGALDKNAINLYIVRSVENEYRRGQTCWLPNAAVLGHLFDGGLLAHEIGHHHWLQHSEYFAEMDAAGLKNIMHSLSNQRAYLSEGEVYRMHFEKLSVLNRVNAFYSNPPARRPEARFCPTLHPGLLKPCPTIGTRLWVDP